MYNNLLMYVHHDDLRDAIGDNNDVMVMMVMMMIVQCIRGVYIEKNWKTKKRYRQMLDQWELWSQRALFDLCLSDFDKKPSQVVIFIC
jgi:hypothetical protein